MLVKALSPGRARALGMLAAALCMVYAVIVFVGGWTYVAKMYEIGIMAQDLPIPQWVPRLVLPIGFALLFLRFGQVFWRLATGRDAHLLGDEVKDALQHAVVDTDKDAR